MSDVADRSVLAFLRNPRLVFYLLITLIIMLAWAYLGFGLAGIATAEGLAGLGPGMALLDQLGLSVDNPLARALAVLCAPGVGIVPDFAGFLLIMLMWFAASAAMMLPSAIPMLSTYTEVADTARAQGKPVVNPSILIAGYLTVWLLFSLQASILQVALSVSGLLTSGLVVGPNVLAGIILICAGLFQFTALKDACLTRCRAPFPILFAHWSEKPSKIYKLGMRQGFDCLGCCWALMLTMLATGVMNILWMALLAILAIIEKGTEGKTVTYGIGVCLILAGGVMLIV